MNNKWKLFYNPFEWIAGWKAFLIGIFIVCITVLVGHVGNTYFYGIQIKHIPGISLLIAFLLQMTGLGITVLTMYLVSIIAAKGVRFQDILGTVTLARYPFLLAALAGFLITPKALNALLTETKIDTQALIQFGVSGIIMILVIILGVALLYNAFKVSTNIKGTKGIFLFILIMIVSEIATMIVVFNYSNLIIK